MKSSKLKKSYSVRTKLYILELKKDPSLELRVKFEMNLLVSELVFENLFSFTTASIESLNIISKKAQKNEETGKLLEEEIERKVEALELSSTTGKEEKIKEISSLMNQRKRLSDDNEFISKIPEMVKIYQVDVEDLVYKTFSFDEKTEIRNGIKLLFRFIANLFPFISGADAIYQLVQEKQIKFSTTDKCIRELNEYWNNCFSLAVSVKYFENVLLSFSRSHSSVSVDAKKCVDETYQKLTSIQAEHYEEVSKKMKEMKN